MVTDTEKIREQVIDAGLKMPESLTLMITNACNLTCPHCLLNCKSANTAPVPEEIILNIIGDFADLGGTSVTITGGEPLLHPCWFNILGHACNAGFKEVVFQTNGVMVTEAVVKKIQTIDSEKIKIQISLDGASAESNDRIRGKGNFKATVSAVKHFVKAGLGNRVRIAFTEMKHNFDDIYKMLKLTDELGAGQVVSGTIVKAGRAKHTDWIEMPDKNQVKDLISLYDTDLEFRTLYDRLGSVSAIEWYKGREVPSDHVCNCISMPLINTEGKMFPCVMNINDDLAVGNVYEQGIKQMILKGLDKWAELPLLDKKRSDLISECDSCSGKAHCRGGCIGRARAANGDIMSVEDRCELRREVYTYRRKR